MLRDVRHRSVGKVMDWGFEDVRTTVEYCCVVFTCCVYLIS